MKIAAEAEGERVPRNFLQLLQGKLKLRTVVMVVIIRVRSADDVSNAIFDSDTAHFFGHFPTLGSVVNVRKNVAVDVNHVVIVSRTIGEDDPGGNAQRSVQLGSCGK